MARTKRRYEYRVVPDDANGWYVIFPDLPGCMGHAQSSAGVGEEAETVRDLWLAVQRESGHPIPEPRDASHDDWWPQGDVVTHDGVGPLMGAPDVAKALGVSKRRVYALAEARGVGHRVGKLLLFTPEDIERLQPGRPGRPHKAYATVDNVAAD